MDQQLVIDQKPTQEAGPPAKGSVDDTISEYTLAIQYVYAEQEYLPDFNRGLADYTEAIRFKPDYLNAYWAGGCA